MQDMFKTNDGTYNPNVSVVAASDDKRMTEMFKLALRDRKEARNATPVKGNGLLKDFE